VSQVPSLPGGTKPRPMLGLVGPAWQPPEAWHALQAASAAAQRIAPSESALAAD